MPSRVLLSAAALLVVAGCASVPDTTNRMWPVKYEEEMATGGTELDFPFPFGRLWSAELDRALAEKDAQAWPQIVVPFPFATETEDEAGLPDTYVVRETQVRPFYRRIDNPAAGKVEHQIVWPFIKVTKRPGVRQAWILPFIFDRTVEVESTGKRDRDWMVFPLIGGSDHEQGRYFLIFPFVGKTYNLFGSEEIRWMPWPLYVEARDREYDSHYIMWPLIGWGSGQGKTMFRILPFYGQKENEGKSWRRNLLWPFFSWGEEELHTKYPIRYFFFFPFYGQNRSDAAWQTTVLYPFFMWAGSKRGWREYQILWPIFRYKTHPTEWAVRCWPLYGTSEFYARFIDEETGIVQFRRESRQSFFLWPLGWDSVFLVPRGRHEYTMFVPFYRRSRYVSVDGEVLGGDQQVWPLYRLRKDSKGDQVLSVLAPIPWGNWRNFEANWSWLWTVAEGRRSADGTERSQKWLWGLIRSRSGKKGSYTGLAFLLEHARDDEEGTEKVELLKGLLGWETSEEDGNGVRLLWFLRIPL